jgi:hypothetical protein
MGHRSHLLSEKSHFEERAIRVVQSLVLEIARQKGKDHVQDVLNGVFARD